ncbi:MAG: TonB-dependent receptor [Flavobacteriales bacterium]
MKRTFIFSLLFSIFLFASSISIAQSVKGFVYEKETGEPIPFANVVEEELSKGTTTDINGYFSLTFQEGKEYNLTISFVGYETKKIAVDLTNTKSKSIKVYLAESQNVLDELELSAEAKEKKTETNVSKINITPSEIKRLPSIGGQADLAQYIQVLPGVVFTGDQGGQLYVRGGTPVQNLVLLDGMTIYSPFHSIGFTSVFDTDLIKNADVYTAAFGSEYGGRMSSVMDIKTKDGNRKRLSGKFSANTFGTKLTLEGPLTKPKEDGFSNNTFILSAKKSYIHQTAKTLYKSAVNSREETIPFEYTDIYGKVTFGSKSGTKLSLYGFNFDDQVNYASQTSFDWNSTGFGGNLIAVMPNSLSILEMDFNYSSFDMNEVGKTLIDGAYVDNSPKNSNINEFKFNFNVKRNLSEEKSFKLGVNFGGGKTEFKFRKSNLVNFNLSNNTSFISGYYKFKYNSTRWVFEPGLRVTAYTDLNEFAIEPRASLKYNATENLRLKASAGAYSQNMTAANSGRQVVNLFNGFISSPNGLPGDFNGDNIDSELQKTFHAVVGTEIDVTPNLSLNIEGYLKQKYQLININLSKASAAAAETNQDLSWELYDFIYEKGKAYGVDLSFNFKKGRFSTNGTYSYGLVELENEQFKRYNPHYDRRHNINLTSSYAFLKDKSLTLDMRFNYGSGFPFSQIIANYQGLNPSGASGEYVTINGEQISLYGSPDGGRLPDYMRLDLSLTKDFKLSKKQALEVNFTITNITNRENIFYYDKINNERVNQLPFMPSFGINWTF